MVFWCMKKIVFGFFILILLVAGCVEGISKQQALENNAKLQTTLDGLIQSNQAQLVSAQQQNANTDGLKKIKELLTTTANSTNNSLLFLQQKAQSNKQAIENESNNSEIKKLAANDSANWIATGNIMLIEAIEVGAIANNMTTIKQQYGNDFNGFDFATDEKILAKISEANKMKALLKLEATDSEKIIKNTLGEMKEDEKKLIIEDQETKTSLIQLMKEFFLKTVSDFDSTKSPIEKYVLAEKILAIKKFNDSLKKSQ